MIRPPVVALLLLCPFATSVSASAASVTCSYAEKQTLTFEVPKRIGDRPAIDFDYPARVTQFSFRDGNLLLVAMDDAEPTRVRIVVSAQLDKASGVYRGQIIMDSGGNQVMLDNGPVSCKAK
jgi:hypothetical protein